MDVQQKNDRWISESILLQGGIQYGLHDILNHCNSNEKWKQNEFQVHGWPVLKRQ